MFEELKKHAKLKMKNLELDGDIWLLEKEDWYSRGRYLGYIEGLEAAESQITNEKIVGD
jgi:hypothetical protein